MALTFTKLADSEDVWGKHRVSVWDVAGDTNYIAGGYALTAANFGMRRIYGAKQIGGNAAAGRLMTHIDTVTASGPFLMFLYPTGSTLASPSAIGDPILNAGATAVTASAATGPFAAGRGKELLAATDASSITVRLLVIGE
jgi:hypothetical protein